MRPYVEGDKRDYDRMLLQRFIGREIIFGELEDGEGYENI
jgi:hypothetical protein